MLSPGLIRPRMAVGVGSASLCNTEERRNENKWMTEDLTLTKTMMIVSNY